MPAVTVEVRYYDLARMLQVAVRLTSRIKPRRLFKWGQRRICFSCLNAQMRVWSLLQTISIPYLTYLDLCHCSPYAIVTYDQR